MPSSTLKQNIPDHSQSEEKTPLFEIILKTYLQAKPYLQT